jgi:hypothetical protein
MRTITGKLKSLGPAVVHGAQRGSKFVTVYSYVEVEDQVIKQLRVPGGIDGKLREALQSAESSTLFTRHNILCGVRLGKGKTFVASASSFSPMGQLFLFGIMAVVSLVVLAIGLCLTATTIAAPAAGIGVAAFFFWVGWRDHGRMFSASLSALGIRDGVSI